jgi:hypothetical protein
MRRDGTDLDQAGPRPCDELPGHARQQNRTSNIAVDVPLLSTHKRRQPIGNKWQEITINTRSNCRGEGARAIKHRQPAG